jgi:hypothetical protein
MLALFRRASLVITVICKTAKSGSALQLKALVAQSQKPLMIIISKSREVLQALESFSAITQCKDYSRRILETAASFIWGCDSFVLTASNLLSMRI